MLTMLRLTRTSLGTRIAACQVHSCASIQAAAAAQSREDEAASAKGPPPGAAFQRVADLTLGDLWNRFERGLRISEGEAFEVEIKPEHGGLTVHFPSGSWLTISKEPAEHALRVQSTLFPTWENKSERLFKMGASAKIWENEDEDEDLYSFLEEGLKSELKVDVNLKESKA